MGRLARVRDVGSRVARRVTPGRDDVPRSDPQRPALSVIVPMYEVEAYLRECLDSILAQDVAGLEVLLVDDGSPDGSGRIAAEYAARDSRFRVVTRPNGGLGAARNTGIREARGRYLTFVDSDDVLPPNALATLMDAASDSGSDIVAGGVSRFDSRRTWQPAWVARVHASRRTSITIEQHLPLLRNLYTWNKVFRRDFWDEQGLWFREGVAYEDQPIITQLLARAKAIDVLPDVVYCYRSRDDQSSISQQTSSVNDLRARILAWEISRETFSRELSPELCDAWLATLFGTHFQWYLISEGTADDTYWEVLRTAVLDFTEGASQAVWDGTEPHKRVLIELARQDRRDDLRELVAQTPGNLRRWPSSVRDDGVLVHLPLLGDPALDDDMFLLHPDQLELVHLVEGFTWPASGVGRLSGWAYLTKVDLSRHEAITHVLLTNGRTGDEVGFAASRRTAPVLAPPVDDPWCDYAPGAFEVDLPLSEVLARGEEGDVWRLAVRVRVGGITRTEPLTRLHRSGSGSQIRAQRQPDGTRLVAESAPEEALGFRTAWRGVEVRDVHVTGRELTGRLAGTHRGEVTGVEVSLGSHRATSEPDQSGVFQIELPLDDSPTPGAPRRWRVRAQRRGGGPWALVPADEVPDVVDPLGPDTNRNGELVVTEWSTGVEAEDVVVRPDGTLLVRGRVHGGATSLSLVATGPRLTAVGAPCEVAAGRFEATLELRSPLYRFGELPLPVGEYDVDARLGGADGVPKVEVPLRLSSALVTAFPMPLVTPSQEGRIQRAAGGGARIVLQRPLGPARGRFQQHRLRKAPQTAPLQPCLVVRSWAGEQATDHGRSVQTALHRRRADLPVYWAVQDHGVPVPDGGIPVISNSAEWFDVLGKAKYVLDNTPQPEHYRKPVGQVLIQGLRGYPSTVASLDLADAGSWDYLISPARYATALLLAGHPGFDGEVLEIGSPRNDVLVSPEADRIRAATRASLGLDEDRTAVLYAPTHRDHLGDRAPVPGFLDLGLARRSLADSVVLLVRGYPHGNRSAPRLGLPPGCIDVTDYPEVSDLLLAADAAVLDYSSLRFDWGITGKPMVFHVPDLEDYRREPGFLVDFESTAPGPLVTTTEEVVRLLGDLDAVRREYAAAYASFRADHLDLEDGRAGERLVEAVFAPRGDA